MKRVFTHFSRAQMMKGWKAENLITPSDLTKYGQSSHVQAIYGKLEKVGSFKEPPSKAFLSKISKWNVSLVKVETVLIIMKIFIFFDLLLGLVFVE